MSKIYRRTTLLAGVNATKKDKNRKRNVIMNFRVSPEEKRLIDERIALSGLMRSEYFINSCLEQEIHVTGNIRTFDTIKKRMELIDKHLCNISMSEELDFEILESLRTVLELLDHLYGSNK